MKRHLPLLTALVLGPMLAPAQAPTRETRYNPPGVIVPPRPETVYNPSRTAAPPPPKAETTYDGPSLSATLPHAIPGREGQGAASSKPKFCPLALISTRTGTPEYDAFSYQIQVTAVRRLGGPMQTAPTGTSGLENQAVAIQKSQVPVGVWLVDSPDPKAAEPWLDAAQKLGMRAVAVTREAATSGRAVKSVIVAPNLIGAAAAREGEALLTAPTKALIVHSGNQKAALDSAQETIRIRSMEKDARPKIQAPRVLELKDDKSTPAELDAEAAKGGYGLVLALDDAAARIAIPRVKKWATPPQVVAFGDSAYLREAVSKGNIQVHLSTDYSRILAAVQEGGADPGKLPVTVGPAVRKASEKK